MKIIACIFLFTMSLAMVLPVLGNNNTAMYKSCMDKCCHKKKNQNKQPENKECNPFLACSAAAWVMSRSIEITKATNIYLDRKYVMSNDDRVVKIVSTFFHPPNFR